MTTFKPRRGASEETNAADTLILEVYLQDGEEAIFCFLSHTAYGTLLQQPWQNSIQCPLLCYSGSLPLDARKGGGR